MLEGLYAGSLDDSNSRMLGLPLAQLEKLATEATEPIDALARFAPRTAVHVLAEIKRASPSKGALSEIADPVELAKTYESAGATGISVLTEMRKFKGSLDDLAAVRSAVQVPLLRKDFISNEYQLLEARANGADIALLIVAGLDDSTLLRLKTFTEDLGMTAFIETHSADEVSRALEVGAKFVGVNARDLSTFETNRNLFGELVSMFPSDVIKVAESAVRTVQDVNDYRAAGADVVLVGEALVTGDARSTLESFLKV